MIPTAEVRKILAASLALAISSCQARPPAEATSLAVPPTQAKAIPIPSPLPIEAPIDSIGPWFFFPRLDAGFSWTPMVASAALLDMHALDAPVRAGDLALANSVSPTGGLVAIRVSPLPYDPEIWIYRLPDTAPIARIPTASPEAQAEQRAAFPQGSDSGPYFDYDPTYATIYGVHSFRWSPNGRYLAYSSANTGPDTDLFLFDAQTGSTRQLTDDRGEALVLDWTPSSSQILFATSNAVDVETGFDASQLSAHDLKSSTTYTLETLTPRGAPFFDTSILGWVSNDEVAIYETGYEGGQSNLRLVNVNESNSKPLRAGFALRPALDQSTSTVFFSLVTSEYLGSDPDEPDGLYMLALPTGRLAPLELGEDRYGKWLESVNTLVICEDEGPRFFNPGSDPRPIPALQDLPPASCDGLTWWPSPDGSKVGVLVRSPDTHSTELRLISSDGKLIAGALQSSSNYYTLSWLPDSSGFIATTVNSANRPTGSLVFHDDANGWKGKTVPVQVPSGSPVYPVNP